MNRDNCVDFLTTGNWVVLDHTQYDKFDLASTVNYCFDRRDIRYIKREGNRTILHFDLHHPLGQLVFYEDDNEIFQKLVTLTTTESKE